MKLGSSESGWSGKQMRSEGRKKKKTRNVFADGRQSPGVTRHEERENRGIRGILYPSTSEEQWGPGRPVKRFPGTRGPAKQFESSDLPEVNKNPLLELRAIDWASDAQSRNTIRTSDHSKLHA